MPGRPHKTRKLLAGLFTLATLAAFTYPDRAVPSAQPDASATDPRVSTDTGDARTSSTCIILGGHVYCFGGTCH